MQNSIRRNEESKRRVATERGGENEEQEYIHKRKEAHNKIRKKKKLYIRSVAESIEEDHKDNNTRKMYQTVNKFKKGYHHTFNMISDKNGELAMNTKETAEIWK